jgi:hypothetical protein
METKIRTGLVACVLAALLAAPAAAQASPKGHARAADRFVERVERLAQRDRDRAARRGLRGLRRELHVASAGTEGMHRRRVPRALVALHRIGAAGDRCVRKLSGVMDELEGAAQVQAATAVEACARLRGQVLEALTKLLERAPERLKPLVVALIERLSGQGDEQAEAIEDACRGHRVEAATSSEACDALPPEVAAHLRDALVHVGDALDHAIESLFALAEDAPEGLAAELEALALELKELRWMLDGLLDGLFAGEGEEDGCREDRVEAATNRDWCEPDHEGEHGDREDKHGDGGHEDEGAVGEEEPDAVE